MWHILQVIIVTVDAESWIDVHLMTIFMQTHTDMEGKSASLKELTDIT